jgi:prevent-host-death family protein
MTTVTAKQLKEHSSQVLGRVQFGKERIAVTKNGKEVAAVVSVEDARLLERLGDLLDIHDALLAIEEAERDGTMSLDELREHLGLQG